MLGSVRTTCHACLRQSALGLAAFSICTSLYATVPEDYASGKRAFLAEMVDRHGFQRESLDRLLAEARYDPDIIAAISRPYEAQPWHRYRQLFVTEPRIRNGVDYWAANSDLLARAEAAFGVPSAVIVAIIGVESHYGDNLGRHRVIDALTTLGFAYPPRAGFFRRELEELLLLTREESIPAATLTGSYAGAVGKPQFIPSSYRAYAVDFDNDGVRDLWRSDADVIGSVASYLARHGWQPGAPIAIRARVESTGAQGVEFAGKRPEPPALPLADLRVAGLAWQGSLDERALATPMRLDGNEGDELWLGLRNFYAITRYNHSNLYAMAVFQLAEAIESAVDEPLASGSG